MKASTPVQAAEPGSSPLPSLESPEALPAGLMVMVGSVPAAGGKAYRAEKRI
jgi:hypothetical protein